MGRRRRRRRKKCLGSVPVVQTRKYDGMIHKPQMDFPESMVMSSAWPEKPRRRMRKKTICWPTIKLRWIFQTYK